MSDKDEGGGLFRRMARKVAAPARELVGMTTPRETEIKPTEFDKAEMKAMIERKRRNDYVRKRELDTLRRIRREGLSGDQAQALTMQSSRMDENTETRSTQSSVQTSGIKAKIDAIERQMVGASSGVSAGGAPKPSPRRAAADPDDDDLRRRGRRADGACHARDDAPGRNRDRCAPGRRPAEPAPRAG